MYFHTSAYLDFLIFLVPDRTCLHTSGSHTYRQSPTFPTPAFVDCSSSLYIYSLEVACDFVKAPHKKG